MNSTCLPESLQSLCTYITLQQRTLQAHLQAAEAAAAAASAAAGATGPAAAASGATATSSPTASSPSISYEGLVSVLPTQALSASPNGTETVLTPRSTWPSTCPDTGSESAKKSNCTSTSIKPEAPSGEGGQLSDEKPRSETKATATATATATGTGTGTATGSVGDESRVVGSSTKSDCDLEVASDSELYFNCHLCSFGTEARSTFNDHLNSHYTFQCGHCDFETRDEAEYNAHLRREHAAKEEEGNDADGNTTGNSTGNNTGNTTGSSSGSRRSSQSVSKRFRCKRCPFVSETKESFWRHQRTHIRREKMFACPKCSFVTDLKHHLEYHLRNHYGSKPFKCPHCVYSCVNKSMLNSHMKSHLTLHQYQCQDCQYATKYCHSLKQHLRKYGHRPGVVLNPDGTPNPLPIIDVYGTRRGPKAKNADDDLMRLDSPFIVKEPQRARAKNKKKAKKSKNGKQSNDTQRDNKEKAKEEQTQNGDKPEAEATRPETAPTESVRTEIVRTEVELPKTEPVLAVEEPNYMSVTATNDYQPLGSSGVEQVGRNDGYNDAINLSSSAQKRFETSVPAISEMPTSSAKAVSRFRCPLCSFETGYRDTFDNHMGMHEAREEENNKDNNKQQELRRILSTTNALPHQPIPHFETSPHLMRYLAPTLPSSSSLSLSGGSSLPSSSSYGSSEPSSALLSRLCMENLMLRLREQQPEPLVAASSSRSNSVEESDGSTTALDLKLGSVDKGVHMRKRRKGQAFKIERRASLDGEAEDLRFKKTLSGPFVCQHCQIAFVDETMFEAHMHFHSEQPLTCQRCNNAFDNARQFFLHLSSHHQ